MKIFLMTPPDLQPTRLSRMTVVPSLGIAYVAAYVEQSGYRPTLLDPKALDLSLGEIAARLTDEKPDVIGISFATENRFDAFETIKVIKNASPNALLVAGGPHPSLAAEDTLKNVPGIDVVVRGEGEETFLELLKCVERKGNFRDVKGIYFRAGNEAVYTGWRPPIAPLDSIPFPAYHLLPMEKYSYQSPFIDESEYSKVAPIITSRGCPYGCVFCATTLLWGKERGRSPQNVVSEMCLLNDEYGKNVFWVVDDSFTYDPERAEQICDLLIREKRGFKLLVQGARVDKVNEGLLRKLRQAGCLIITFGVESGSQRIIDGIIGKRITIQQVVDTSRLCKEIGMPADFGFIVGHPTETLEDVEKTLALVERIHSDGNTTAMNPMKIYPGTRLERMAHETGALSRDFSWAIQYPKGGLLGRSIKGNAPFYFGSLDETAVYSVMARWINMARYPIHKHALDGLSEIRSWDDLCHAIRLALAYSKEATRSLFRRRSRSGQEAD